MLRNHRCSDVYIVVFFEASEIPIYPRCVQCLPMHRRHRCPQAPRRALSRIDDRKRAAFPRSSVITVVPDDRTHVSPTLTHQAETYVPKCGSLC
ncbi:hypothetical protein AVEN_146737-1 [Araneus ventricosus]|uniref:Uncharacterized protein n=1 Tax=Araneus ventricosus TaxID=182803 RepID=A0A4Y2TLH3_ARAVE|nr:hypothetical protein AVEN_146737-1 [Araneus ventricosus]